jgi:hypothetical protein
MADYIVCHKKRNAPRINVRICQEKCPLKNECQEYSGYLKVSAIHKPIPVSAEIPPLALAAQ